MKRFSPTNLLCVCVLLLLFVGGGSMLYGKFFASEAPKEASQSIDWRARYPFGTPAPQKAEAPARKQTFSDKIADLQARLDSSRDCLFGRQTLLELCGAFRRATYQTKTDEIVLLNNGYLTTIVNQTDEQTERQIADSVLRLQETTQSAGIPLLYIQVPQKVCQYDDQMPPGELSYINQNLDRHLALLQAGGIDTLDLRQALHENGLSHYGLYFRTDHHWTMAAGLWAAQTVAEALCERGFALDTALLSEENFIETTYSDWYLGTQGRRVTRGYIAPDDFTILLPEFATDLRVEHPDKGIDVQGSFFDTVFDHAMLETKDYYGLSTYESVLCGNRPLTRITNNQNPDGLRVLLIHDSYSTVVAPYLSLLCGQIDMIDVRAANGNFNGSLDAYRDEMQPDIVIVMYCSPVNIDRSAG